MKYICLFLAFLISTGSGVAQNVDFEIPAEINIVQGRLSVAFNDNVTEEKANEIVASMGYDVLQSAFVARDAFVLSHMLLSAAEANKIESDPRVIALTQTDLPENVQSTRASRNKPRYRISVSFQSDVTNKEAKEILSRQQSVEFHLSQKRPNELVIDVGDQDEIAFNSLQKVDEVKWVTYVGIADGN